MYLVFDIETKNTFDEVGSHNPQDLETSYVGYYRSDQGIYEGVWENEITSKFLPILKEADFVIGYNIVGFDLPALSRYGDVAVPQNKIIDLYKITYEQAKLSVKLDNWTSTTLGKGKIGHGLDAVRYFRNGQLDELAKYCNMDVEVTRDLYEYVKSYGKVMYTDGMGKVKEVNIVLPNQKPAEPEGPVQASMF